MEWNFYGVTGPSEHEMTSVMLAGVERPISLPTIVLDAAGVVTRVLGQDVIVGINDAGLVTGVAPAPRASEIEVA